MASNHEQHKWHKTGNNQWTVRPARGYTATIDYAPGPNPYTLTVNPGAVVSAWPTLRNAKNAFRKFLSDKPVD